MNVWTRLLSFMFVALLFLTSCSKPIEPTMEEPMVDDEEPFIEIVDPDETMGTQDDSVLIEMGLEDQADEVDSLAMDPLSQRLVYFGFDESIVTEEAQVIIRAHAQLLAQHPEVTLHLAGHADERGTREYNLALGEQRAVAVSAFFQEFGVDATRITTVSFGEELPAVTGADEESWALNRRVEITHDLVQ